MQQEKPRLSFLQIWNMSFGFLGIQFGWGLQMANMSPIYKYLGADESTLPYLWLAGPLTGLLVQPIVGAMSDRTWTRLGRRRPYFLVGAILASICLILMPNSSALWMAAGLLWIMDASINITMEPFRAFVGDNLPEEQHTLGFVMQSFFIGVGQTLANALPFILTWLGVVGVMKSGIPYSTLIAFIVGAVCFLLAVLWTVFNSTEYPPADMEEFLRKKNEKRLRYFPSEVDYSEGKTNIGGFRNNIAGVLVYLPLGIILAIIFLITKKENKFVNFHANQSIRLGIVCFLIALLSSIIHQALISVNQIFLAIIIQIITLALSLVILSVTIFALIEAAKGKMWTLPLIGVGTGGVADAINEIPKTMWQLAIVQFFTWFALPCMWQFYGITVARHVFNAADEKSPAFAQGTEWGGLCFAVYNVVCFLVAFALPSIAAAMSRKMVHIICLACGGLGLLSTYFATNPYFLWVGMAGVGIAWASILSMPYVILAGAIKPERMGVYMGVFNLFIVIPQVVMSFVVPQIYKNILGGDPLNVVMLGGFSLLVAALSVLIVKDVGQEQLEITTGGGH